MYFSDSFDNDCLLCCIRIHFLLYSCNTGLLYSCNTGLNRVTMQRWLKREAYTRRCALHILIRFKRLRNVKNVTRFFHSWAWMYNWKNTNWELQRLKKMQNVSFFTNSSIYISSWWSSYIYKYIFLFVFYTRLKVFV